MSTHLQSQIRFMLLGKGGMYFKDGKHLFQYRITCEKVVLQRCFTISLWKDGVTTPEKKSSFL